MFAVIYTDRLRVVFDAQIQRVATTSDQPVSTPVRLISRPQLFFAQIIRRGSRKKYLGAWPLIIWEATTAKRNYYRTNYINQ